MVIAPKIRGFICTTAHPDGCAAHVQEQIDYVKSQPPLAAPPKKVLVIGSSTGYGLSSRITAAFSGKAATLGVFFERPGSERRTASAGWYNSIAVEKAAHAEGLYAKSINGDAFSNEIKAETIETIKADLGQVDLVIYSLASPRRTDPTTGETYSSVLKPIGETFRAKTLDTNSGEVSPIEIEPASDEEIAATTKVMGGEDWAMWMDALAEAGVLAEGATTVAYSYLGPEVTWDVYKDGTIGTAKIDLEEKCKAIADKHGCRSYVSVNKAVVTQASSAIPVVPLYISILFKKMKEIGNHEGCIEQLQRLFATQLCNGGDPELDEAGRIRIDDWEMREDIQDAVAEIWPAITTETLADHADFAGYQQDFLKLFGFGIDGIDYEADVAADEGMPSMG